jgi:tetratricopeptide (TPR) repeat protein
MPARPTFRLLALLILASRMLAQATGSQGQALNEAARLDAEQKCDEAESYYRKAQTIGPASSTFLNNLGNHYLACGAPEKAREAFERLLKINPAHPNANLQLARLALARKEGPRALDYISRLGDHDPEVLLVRAEALHQTGKPKDAAIALDGFSKAAGNDPRLLFALGLACGRMGLYERAETAFSQVLARYPNEFDVLYNLGLAAARAGQYSRAQRTLEIALKARPADADTLYELGRVETSLQDYTRAVYLLAQARKLAPQRPDVLLALARAAQMGAYYGDCLLAYDDYLKLRPDDDMVRRDRALVYGFTRTGLEESRKELNRYVEKHPGDAVGFYDLAQLLDRTDRAQALDRVSTAVRLDGKLQPARYYRAWLLHKLGRSEESLAELQIAVQLNPRDARAFDLMGLDHLNLEKPADAEQALRKALALAPNDPEILFHLGRALLELGRAQDAKPFLDRFQQVRQLPTRVPREEPGMIEAASLTRAQRSERLIEQLRSAAKASPFDPSLKMNLARGLLAEGRTEEAAGVFRELLAANPPGALLHEAGKTLLRFEQYALARDFLERAAQETPTARLDLAIALYFTAGPQTALKALEQVPDSEDTGDYLLLKADLLDAAGHIAEADQVLDESLRHSISRPRLVEEAALLLVRHRQNAKALELVTRVLKSMPGDAGMMLAKVLVLGSMGRNDEARNALKDVQTRWPEWDRPYLLEGLLLERASHPLEAREKIQIALALGSQEPAARCALARITSSAAPDAQCACTAGIYEMFFPACNTR